MSDEVSVRELRVVNISRARAQLSALVAQVRAGDPVLIAKAGTPVAVLSAYEASSEPRTLGGWEGRVWIADHFDEPLLGELQRHFEVRENVNLPLGAHVVSHPGRRVTCGSGMASWRSEAVPVGVQPAHGHWGGSLMRVR